MAYGLTSTRRRVLHRGLVHRCATEIVGIGSGLRELPRILLLGSRVNSPCATFRAPDGLRSRVARPRVDLARSRTHFSGCLFDEFSHGCRLRHIDRVATRGLVNGRTRPLGHRALGRRGDHPVLGGD